MADKLARALNLLGADRDLFNTADGNGLHELIDEYLDEPDNNEGITPPCKLLNVGQDSLAGSELDSSADLTEVDEDDDDEEPSCTASY